MVVRQLCEVVRGVHRDITLKLIDSDALPPEVVRVAAEKWPRRLRLRQQGVPR